MFSTDPINGKYRSSGRLPLVFRSGVGFKALSVGEDEGGRVRSGFFWARLVGWDPNRIQDLEGVWRN